METSGSSIRNWTNINSALRTKFCKDKVIWVVKVAMSMSIRGQRKYMVVVVVVAFSSCARIFGECSTIHFPPALFFVK